MPLPTQKTKPRTGLNNLSIFIHAEPKFGKTTFASQFPDALIIATEPGTGSLEVFEQRVTSWAQFLDVCRELAEGKHPFRTIAIDTVDLLYRLCVEHVLVKAGVDHASDLGFGKGYEMIAAEWQRVISKLCLLRYSILFISHTKHVEVETRTGKISKAVPTMPEKARIATLAMCDVILFGNYETTKDAEGRSVSRRVWRTKGSPHWEAGDRTLKLPEAIPVDFKAFADAFAAPPAASVPVKPAEQKPADKPATSTTHSKPPEKPAGEKNAQAPR